MRGNDSKIEVSMAELELAKAIRAVHNADLSWHEAENANLLKRAEMEETKLKGYASKLEILRGEQ